MQRVVVTPREAFRTSHRDSAHPTSMPSVDGWFDLLTFPSEPSADHGSNRPLTQGTVRRPREQTVLRGLLPKKHSSSHFASVPGENDTLLVLAPTLEGPEPKRLIRGPRDSEVFSYIRYS